ncbi:MAG: Mov34/MPN/PAD-1 family protein [Deltaproteobacteria bacterium]|nr:Mov34/MPN/PAD-1 family protein [Deltaproteobacteria bacterium]
MKTAHAFRQCEPEDSDFVPLGSSAEARQALERTRARSDRRVYRGQDGFEVAVPEHVMTRVVAFGRRAEPDEWYGLLIGQLCDDPKGEHVVVHGVVHDPGVSASPGSVETSTQSEFQTRFAARALYPDSLILGWVHTHPHMRARFSQPDHRNQRTWTQSHSLGLVIDPWNPVDAALYRGPRAELLTEIRDNEEPIARVEQGTTRVEAPAIGRIRSESRWRPALQHALQQIRGLKRWGMLVGAVGLVAGVTVSLVKIHLRISRMTAQVEQAESRLASSESSSKAQQFRITEIEGKLQRWPSDPGALVCDALPPPPPP